MNKLKKADARIRRDGFLVPAKSSDLAARVVSGVLFDTTTNILSKEIFRC
jgi:hypothetical protein